MKILLSFLLLAFLLTACCGNPASTQPTTTIPATAPTDAATPSKTVPAEETIIPATAPTEPIHSALYIPGVDIEDVIVWFNEVCLDAEFVNSGDATLLQKWTLPIRYSLHGTYTEEDLATLNSFAQWLNTIEGFPGIAEAGEDEPANLQIHFCTPSEMTELMGSQYTNMDGTVTFWYNMDNEIYDAIICCLNSLGQTLRNSVILEELYNGLGPIQDTSLRPDSLIYAEFSEPQELSEIDKLILQLLYHPDMECGMDSVQCEEVIRKLYY
jgi:hypothetical protein